jgi:hypothetical protein
MRFPRTLFYCDPIVTRESGEGGDPGRKVLFGVGLIGAGDGNRTRDQQLGKLNDIRSIEHNQ